MVSINNLSITALDGGFSNPGGARNLGATTIGVSLDQFNQLQSKYEILEARVKRLAAKGEVSSIKLNGHVFISMGEFVALHDQNVLR